MRVGELPPLFVIDDFAPLVMMMQEDSEVMPDIYEMNGRSLTIHTAHNYLYLKNGVNGMLIVSNVTLRHRHNGSFSRMLNWMKSYASEKGYLGIELESVISDEMRAFANKHGFTPYGVNWDGPEAPFVGNYRLTW